MSITLCICMARPGAGVIRAWGLCMRVVLDTALVWRVCGSAVCMLVGVHWLPLQ
jgi:hypothetical protein